MQVIKFAHQSSICAISSRHFWSFYRTLEGGDIFQRELFTTMSLVKCGKKLTKGSNFSTKPIFKIHIWGYKSIFRNHI